MLAEDIRQRVTAGTDAPHALTAAFDAQADLLREGGGYLAERAADLDDLRDRASRTVLGRPVPGIPDRRAPFVLVGRGPRPGRHRELLDPDAGPRASSPSSGGPTSHTAILARGAGHPGGRRRSPASTGIADGTIVAVDGTRGTVTVAASSPSRGRRGAAPAPQEEPRRPRSRPHQGRPPGRPAQPRTSARLKDVRAGAAGRRPAPHRVPVPRTARTRPTVAEQHAAYLRTASTRSPAARSSSARWTPAPTSPCRSRRHPTRRTRRSASGACARAARDPGPRRPAGGDRLAAAATTRTCWVMAPMVATPAEAAASPPGPASPRHRHVGAMIEIPAAALRARDLLAERRLPVSIGTNDLAPVHLSPPTAMLGALADLLDPWQPALLALVAPTPPRRRRQRASRPASAGRRRPIPRLAPVFVGLGVTSLSMAAAAVPAVRAALSARTLSECRDLGARARDAVDPAAARQAVAASEISPS